MGAVISSPLGGTEGGAGGGGGGYGAKVGGAAEGILGRMYSSCEGNPLGAVHRAWGVSLIFIVIFFVVAIAEGELYIYMNGGSVSLRVVLMNGGALVCVRDFISFTL